MAARVLSILAEENRQRYPREGRIIIPEFLISPENDLAHFDASEEFENLYLHLEIGYWKLDVGH
jgi:hypothetical protein